VLVTVDIRPQQIQNPDAEQVVAIVNGRQISQTELDQRVSLRLQKLEEQKYQLRRAVLEQIIIETLVERAAATSGMSVEEWKAQLFAGATASEDELDEAYRIMHGTAQEEDPGLRQQLRRKIEESRRKKLWQSTLDDLKDEADIEIRLAPPRDLRHHVDIQGRPSRGAGSIMVVEFADFQCEHCRAVHETLKQLLREYPAEIRLVFKHLPLPHHPGAFEAAEASECAGEEGKFWEYHDLLFEHGEDLSMERLTEFAESLGLDTEGFEECLASHRQRPRINRDINEARLQGFSGTPTFLINGRLVAGGPSLEEFRAIIDSQISAPQGEP